MAREGGETSITNLNSTPLNLWARLLRPDVSRKERPYHGEVEPKNEKIQERADNCYRYDAWRPSTTAEDEGREFRILKDTEKTAIDTITFHYITLKKLQKEEERQQGTSLMLGWQKEFIKHFETTSQLEGKQLDTSNVQGIKNVASKYIKDEHNLALVLKMMEWEQATYQMALGAKINVLSKAQESYYVPKVQELTGDGQDSARRVDVNAARSAHPIGKLVGSPLEKAMNWWHKKRSGDPASGKARGAIGKQEKQGRQRDRRKTSTFYKVDFVSGGHVNVNSNLKLDQYQKAFLEQLDFCKTEQAAGNILTAEQQEKVAGRMIALVGARADVYNPGSARLTEKGERSPVLDKDHINLVEFDKAGAVGWNNNYAPNWFVLEGQGQEIVKKGGSLDTATAGNIHQQIEGIQRVIAEKTQEKLDAVAKIEHHIPKVKDQIDRLRQKVDNPTKDPAEKARLRGEIETKQLEEEQAKKKEDLEKEKAQLEARLQVVKDNSRAIKAYQQAQADLLQCRIDIAKKEIEIKNFENDKKQYENSNGALHKQYATQHKDAIDAIKKAQGEKTTLETTKVQLEAQIEQLKSQTDEDILKITDTAQGLSAKIRRLDKQIVAITTTKTVAELQAELSQLETKSKAEPQAHIADKMQLEALETYKDSVVEGTAYDDIRTRADQGLEMPMVNQDFEEFKRNYPGYPPAYLRTLQILFGPQIVKANEDGRALFAKAIGMFSRKDFLITLRQANTSFNNITNETSDVLITGALANQALDTVNRNFIKNNVFQYLENKVNSEELAKLDTADKTKLDTIITTTAADISAARGTLDSTVTTAESAFTATGNPDQVKQAVYNLLTRGETNIQVARVAAIIAIANPQEAANIAVEVQNGTVTTANLINILDTSRQANANVVISAINNWHLGNMRNSNYSTNLASEVNTQLVAISITASGIEDYLSARYNRQDFEKNIDSLDSAFAGYDDVNVLAWHISRLGSGANEANAKMIAEEIIKKRKERGLL